MRIVTNMTRDFPQHHSALILQLERTEDQRKELVLVKLKIRDLMLLLAESVSVLVYSGLSHHSQKVLIRTWRFINIRDDSANISEKKVKIIWFTRTKLSKNLNTKENKSEMVCWLSVIILKVTGNGPLQGKETSVALLQNAKNRCVRSKQNLKVCYGDTPTLSRDGNFSQQAQSVSLRNLIFSQRSRFEEFMTLYSPT